MFIIPAHRYPSASHRSLLVYERFRNCDFKFHNWKPRLLDDVYLYRLSALIWNEIIQLSKSQHKTLPALGYNVHLMYINPYIEPQDHHDIFTWLYSCLIKT